MISSRDQTVAGDVLLSAAYISLLGGFTFTYRNKLIKKWKGILSDHGLPVSEDFNFNEVFGDNIKIRDWQYNGLASDHMSVSNAIIMEKSKHYCICIDPQYQAQTWLKQQYFDAGLLTTKYSDPHFKRTLEMAIEMGKPVIVESIGQHIDLLLYSLLKK